MFRPLLWYTIVLFLHRRVVEYTKALIVFWTEPPSNLLLQRKYWYRLVPHILHPFLHHNRWGWGKPILSFLWGLPVLVCELWCSKLNQPVSSRLLWVCRRLSLCFCGKSFGRIMFVFEAKRLGNITRTPYHKHSHKDLSYYITNFQPPFNVFKETIFYLL